MKIQLNPDIDTNPVIQLCALVKENSFVENCITYKSRLQNLLDQEGVQPETEAEVATAKEKLEDGIRINKKIYDDLLRRQNILQDAKKDFVIYRFVKIYEEMPVCIGKIEDYSNYMYSPIFIEKCSILEDEALKLLNQQFENALKNIKCNITQLSQLKQLYKKASLTFITCNKKEYADKINARISNIEEDLYAKQKYESVLAECEKDASLCKNIELISYKQCEEMTEKMTNWRLFVKSKEDLPVELKSSLISKIDVSIETLNQRKRDIESIANNLIKSIQNIQEFEGIIKVSQKITELKKLEINKELTRSIEEMEKDISQCLSFCNSISSNIAICIEQEQTLSGLQNNSCFNICRKIYSDRLCLLRSMEEKWINENIVYYEKSLFKLSADECVKWLSIAETLPEFMEEQEIIKCVELKKKIRERLKDCRVQGVVSMFLSLNVDEKKQCLDILSKI